MDPFRIAVFIGSLRRDSWTRKVADAMRSLAPPTLSFDEVRIGDLPLYNQDLDVDGQVPEAWTRFRDRARPAQGVLFFTPEYNRGMPGVLKNAIDVGSRPYGKSVFSKKPGGVVSVSPGQLGAVNANMDVRRPMVFLDVPMLQQPEAYVGNVAKLFDDQGQLASDDTRKFFTSYVEAYAAWVAKLAG